MRRFLSACLIAFVSCCSIATAGTRVIVMPGENPRSIDQNGAARFERLDKGTWRKDALGTVCTTGAYANLSVVPNGGMYVAVQPTAANTEGSIYQMGADDVNPIPQGSWSSSLAADNTQICIHGMQAGPSASIGPITAPGSGSNQYFLVEAQIQSVDNNSQSILFINSNNSSSFQTVNTNRVDAIVYQIKAGVVNGSAPSPDSGWIGIANILVPGGTGTITSGMISALPAFGGFISNGVNVTLNGLTLSGFSSGCLQTNSSGVVSSQACTSGLGSVVGNSPITASTVGGVATIGCTACVTSVNGSTNISSSGGTAPTLSITGTIPFANLPTTVAQTNANNNFSVLQTLAAASVTGNTSTNSLNVSSWSVGNASATPPPQTGTNGAYVVAQATSAPTAQPGNVGVSGSVSAAHHVVSSESYGTDWQYWDNCSGGNGTFGPESGVTVSGITASAFGVGCAGSNEVSVDTSGNMGVAASIYANGNLYVPVGAGVIFGPNASGTPYFANSGSAVVLTAYTTNTYSLVVNGNVTASGFYTGSRREWKKNITPFAFDPLNLLSHIDYAEYDCKTLQCGPAGTHKVGIIANDSPVQVSGKKHDHYDAFALAAIDGKAIVELAIICACLFAVLFMWCIVLTVLVMRRA